MACGARCPMPTPVHPRRVVNMLIRPPSQISSPDDIVSYAARCREAGQLPQAVVVSRSFYEEHMVRHHLEPGLLDIAGKPRLHWHYVYGVPVRVEGMFTSREVVLSGG